MGDRLWPGHQADWSVTVDGRRSVCRHGVLGRQTDLLATGDVGKALPKKRERKKKKREEIGVGNTFRAEVAGRCLFAVDED